MICTISALLRERAATYPDKAAIQTWTRSLTFAELESSTAALASALLSDYALQPGDRVAIHWNNAIEAVQMLLACFRAGLIAVPVSPFAKAPEVEHVLRHSGARLCFSEPSLARAAVEAGGRCGIEVRSRIPEPQGGAAPVLPESDPDAPAVIIYTTGTTALPKGAVHTQRSLTGPCPLFVPGNLDDSSVLLAVTMLMHGAGLKAVLLPSLWAGATTVLLRSFNAKEALEMIAHFRCTYILILPVLLQFLLEEQDVRPRDLSSLRSVLVGGDAATPALRERFQAAFGFPFREILAMTEVFLVSCNPPGDKARPGSIGLPVDGMEVRVVVPIDRDAAPGETGQVVVRAPGNCVGYWNDPVNTAVLFRDGWLHTGDLAMKDADGYLWFRGRLKNIIVRGACNVSPLEVEELLATHPAVLEAGVTGVPHPVYNEVPVACVRLRDGMEATERELKEYAFDRLADYKVPERVLVLPELPRGMTGKLDRQQLLRMLTPVTASAGA